ncbi:hypothetical protein DFP72DRAFT_807143 [Ephemerocybe angulata]|uniref:Uncharacterized protein n=1 Tax=Ephemerocybe angulata TaxID=980116 RepID=A0A8H6I4Z1_9AGAR|nr:hypothetical protein DFP72DRAFT_807143 [Tulosesus angulatus]
MNNIPMNVNMYNTNFVNVPGGFNAGAQQGGIGHHADPNSPRLFTENLANVLTEVFVLRDLATEALKGIQGAYHASHLPSNTAHVIAELKLALESLMSILRSSGVGALPLLPTPPVSGATPTATAGSANAGPAQPVVPTEAQLLAEANTMVKVLYDTLGKKQESASVVANLLAVEQANRGAK